MTTKTGFIGLGNIGKPMAVNLARSEFETWVYDVFPEPCEDLAKEGAHIAQSPAAMAEEARVIGICVRNDADTFDVISGENGILQTAKPGTLVAIHSTVRPDTVKKLAELASKKDVVVFDAPITGGAHGAEAKELCYMVGAEKGTYEKSKAVFETSGKTVVHAGPITSGIKLKLCNNLMTYMQFLAVHESMKLAKAGDLDLDILRKVSTDNGLMNVYMQMVFDSKKGFDNETWADITAGVRNVAVKDLQIMLEYADELEISLPGTGLVREQIKQVYGKDT